MDRCFSTVIVTEVIKHRHLAVPRRMSGNLPAIQ